MTQELNSCLNPILTFAQIHLKTYLVKVRKTSLFSIQIHNKNLFIVESFVVIFHVAMAAHPVTVMSPAQEPCMSKRITLGVRSPCELLDKCQYVVPVCLSFNVLMSSPSVCDALSSPGFSSSTNFLL